MLATLRWGKEHRKIPIVEHQRLDDSWKALHSSETPDDIDVSQLGRYIRSFVSLDLVPIFHKIEVGADRSLNCSLETAGTVLQTKSPHADEVDLTFPIFLLVYESHKS